MADSMLCCADCNGTVAEANVETLFEVCNKVVGEQSGCVWLQSHFPCGPFKRIRHLHFHDMTMCYQRPAEFQNSSVGMYAM